MTFILITGETAIGYGAASIGTPVDPPPGAGIFMLITGDTFVGFGPRSVGAAPEVTPPQPQPEPTPPQRVGAIGHYRPLHWPKGGSGWYTPYK